MTMQYTVYQAAMTALIDYLKSPKSGLPIDWKYDCRWPDPDKRLPAKNVTILASGPVQWTMMDPRVVAGPFPTDDPNIFTWTWFLRAGTMPVQLDIWATSSFNRDDMLARLDPVLNSGTSVTGTNAMGLPDDPFRNGILLALAHGWSGNCDFVFNEPEWVDDPSSVQKSEYRATMRGEAVFNLTAQANSPQLTQIEISELLSELSTAPVGTLKDNYVFDSSTGRTTWSTSS